MKQFLSGVNLLLKGFFDNFLRPWFNQARTFIAWFLSEPYTRISLSILLSMVAASMVASYVASSHNDRQPAAVTQPLPIAATKLPPMQPEQPKQIANRLPQRIADARIEPAPSVKPQPQKKQITGPFERQVLDLRRKKEPDTTHESQTSGGKIVHVRQSNSQSNQTNQKLAYLDSQKKNNAVPRKSSTGGALKLQEIKTHRSGQSSRSEQRKYAPKNGVIRTNRSTGTLQRIRLAGRLNRVLLTLNKSETIQTEESYATALIGNSDIADVVPLSERLIYVLAKKIGTTRLTVLDQDKNLLGIVEIEVTYDIDKLESQFRQLLPQARIDVRSINQKILLTGTVPDAPSLQTALTLAEQIAPGSVNHSLAVASPQQVMLEVRILEANRAATKDLGVGWTVVANRLVGATLLNNVAGASEAAGVAATLGGDVTRLLTGGLGSGNAPFGTTVARLVDGGVKVDAIIQALEQKDLARRLAEPNLIALSGDTANFLAGGEFPYPIPSGEEKGSPTIQFKKFGVSLNFTPTVLGNGLINIQIEPEVSELSLATGVEVGGVKIPSIVVRRAKTTVELRDGQSFAIAGLLQSTNARIQSQVPVLGDVPVIGSLFRSASYQRRETDLVIIVTPRLVRPAIPGQQLQTPLDKRLSTSDFEFFLNGRAEVPAERPVDGSGHIIRGIDRNPGFSNTSYKDGKEPALENGYINRKSRYYGENAKYLSGSTRNSVTSKPLPNHGHMIQSSDNHANGVTRQNKEPPKYVLGPKGDKTSQENKKKPNREEDDNNFATGGSD